MLPCNSQGITEMYIKTINQYTIERNQDLVTKKNEFVVRAADDHNHSVAIFNSLQEAEKYCNGGYATYIIHFQQVPGYDQTAVVIAENENRAIAILANKLGVSFEVQYVEVNENTAGFLYMSSIQWDY